MGRPTSHNTRMGRITTDLLQLLSVEWSSFKDHDENVPAAVELPRRVCSLLNCLTR